MPKPSYEEMRRAHDLFEAKYNKLVVTNTSHVRELTKVRNEVDDLKQELARQRKHADALSDAMAIIRMTLSGRTYSRR